MPVTVDPDKLLALAKQVYNDSNGKMYNAHYAVKEATLDSMCFGIIGNTIIGGPYEDARQKFEKATDDATNSLTSAATGLANVATIFEQAENANTMVLSLGTPEWTGEILPGQPASLAVGTGSLEFIAFGGIEIIYNLVLGTVSAVVDLVPLTAAAYSLWFFAQPDDSEINAALQSWAIAVGDVKASRADLTQILTSGLEDAWPTGQGARAAFDIWIKALEADLQQLEDSITKVPTAINSAVTDIHICSEFLLAVVTAGLLTIIALTALDIFFGAGEGAKNAVGAAILAAVASTVTTITALLTKMAWDVGKEISDRGNFKDATTNLPDFTQLTDPNAWQTGP